MNARLFCGASLALAMSVGSIHQSYGGVILITTRKAQDLTYATTDALDAKGPGQLSQGDAAMATLLGDHGYSSRLVLDFQLTEAPDSYFGAAEPLNTSLVIVSGSSGSADVPMTRDKGVPVIMGEHSCIGDRANLAETSDLFLYFGGSTSGNIVNPTGGQYMKVTAVGKEHPILKGIPLDEQDRIKIFRDPYPQENANVPEGGKPNYQYSWNAIDAAGAEGTDTKVLGLLDSNQAKSVFGVIEAGGKLSNGENAANRYVHWLVNEDGSGGARRMFHCMTDAGRLIFVRTVKWALGEEVPAFVPLRIKDVTVTAAGRINLEWDAVATKNYKVFATTDVAGGDWQTLVEDIPGKDGLITRTLDIAVGPQTAFLKIRGVP
jgi:hypothetical protein